jgi:hypothetical protein
MPSAFWSAPIKVLQHKRVYSMYAVIHSSGHDIYDEQVLLRWAQAYDIISRLAITR